MNFEHEKDEIVLGTHHRDGLNSYSTLFLRNNLHPVQSWKFMKPFRLKNDQKSRVDFVLNWLINHKTNHSEPRFDGNIAVTMVLDFLSSLPNRPFKHARLAVLQHVRLQCAVWVAVLSRMAQTDDYVLNATILATHPYNSQTKYSLQGKQAAGKHSFFQSIVVLSLPMAIPMVIIA